MLGACDMAGQASRIGWRIVPAEVYRTFARLMRQRHVPRIEMPCAYVPQPPWVDLCLVCLECHGVPLIENPALGVIHTDATEPRSRLAAAPLKAGGLCGTCVDGISVKPHRNAGDHHDGDRPCLSLALPTVSSRRAG